MLKFIKTSTTGILTTFGKYDRLMRPGLNWYIPYIQRVIVVSNRLTEDSLVSRVLTKDRVFANFSISIQYKINPDDSEKAYFNLDNPSDQMKSYISNELRRYASDMSFWELYGSFDNIGKSVRDSLKEMMSENGYTINNILVTKIEPDSDVSKAINEVARSERLKEAAKNEAEAEYIRKIREAEGDSKRKILQGEGIAGQRNAILAGYSKNISDLAKYGLSYNQIMEFILKSQDLDTRERIGTSQNTKVIFVGESRDKSLTEQLIASHEAQK